MISKKAAQKLIECFAGEVVVFYLKDMKIAAVSEDGEQMMFNGMIDGLVVDIDETFFYLGDDDGNINKTVRHDIIAITEIAEHDPTEQLIMGLPNEDEIH